MFEDTLVVAAMLSARIGLPLVLALAAGALLRRWYLARGVQPLAYSIRSAKQAAGSGRARPAFSHAPRCWDVKNCPPQVREKCPAYSHPKMPCWLAIQLVEGRTPTDCATCVLHAPVTTNNSGRHQA
ncbi:MAG: hypothetical protein AB1566_06150 [Chloroflexota bacterium]